MASSVSYSRFLNPWVLHLQKMGLELKCPLCLNLLNRPMLLPCNHIFCSNCIPPSTQFGSECAICKVIYVDRELRTAPHIENMVSIYRAMDAALNANIFNWGSQTDVPDVGMSSGQSLASNATDIADKFRQKSVETNQRKCSAGGGRSTVPQSAPNKQVSVPSNHSDYGIENSGRPDILPGDGNDRDVGRWGGENASPIAEGNSPFLLFSQHGDAWYENRGSQEIDVNQVAQTSLDSPPSFGDPKESDYESSALNAEKYQAKGSVKNEYDGRIGTERNMPVSEVQYNCCIKSKRQKLNYELKEMAVTSCTNSQSTVCGAGNVKICSPDSKPKARGSFSTPHPSILSEDSEANKNFSCAFCQSYRLSEVVTGPMFHYSNGKAVTKSDAYCSSVLHVHKKCIEWAPQVYFVGETVMNLEAEVARGAKLKCSRCGLKGAALGCYVKSCRRSYHVPCAVEVSDCRWDCENFLMLCPAHTSFEFPAEKPESGKKTDTNSHSAIKENSLHSNKFWMAAGGVAKKWVICGAALSVEEKKLLDEFVNVTGATVSKLWRPDVTHVIAATDEMGACSRTLKVLMAILNGRWVLKFDWIKACLEAMNPVDEEPYEISRDIYGCCDGPKNGRLRVMEKAPKLFTGLSFYFSGEFVPSYKGYLEDLVLAAGATVLTDKFNLASQRSDAQATSQTVFIVYNLDPPRVCESEEENLIMEQRLKVAEDLAADTGSRVVGHTSLLESVAACELEYLDT